ncbi:carbon-monoxide dehydrogenase large subunit [Pseudonocardia thermophila]|jgi:Aerobic-type carbon monoxide dehydrogenase, large subunit CoxL/CutL homologs|uniref:Carbon-monoxide dehydrogenase large subunit n=1 Tax=Pseudonocardia thermophila TaxID=1848 RepID=A0A1M6T641_PSETH|nr:xanthine dehydrogenase family protein molybdopterin-binding subunit [Pseudonocardia thermophila]SHK52410.1 carbon-monoxide dehydrogenase large subunit [Pseudonocardia thermophila]
MAGGSAISGLVGARVHRKEDRKILTGTGRYVDDVQERGMLHAHFLRSTVPHARIVSIDVSKALEVEGVVRIFTGADMSAIADDLNFAQPIPGLHSPSYPAIARDVVRFVGEPVAMIVAESRYIAEDAAELIEVEYDELPPVMSTKAAMAEGAPQLFGDVVPGNIVHTDEQLFGDIEAAFAQADHIVTDTLDQHRWACNPMETRGGVATYDRGSGQLTYEASTQTTHTLRFLLAGWVRHPIHQFRVIANNIGGGFGLKFSAYREDVAVCAAAKAIGGTVKWVEDRNEHLIAAGAAREEQLTLEAAVKADGQLLGLRVTMDLDAGAYPINPPATVYTGLVRTTLPGPYRLPAYQFRHNIVATNKASYISLRGPWAVETLVRERLMDKIARTCGISPVEVRRRNLITLADQPTKMITNVTLENVTAAETFEKLVSMIDFDEVRREQEEARARGKLLGFGLGTFIEPAPGTKDFWAAVGFPFGAEPARIRIEIDGKVTVFTPQTPHGQSHETTLSQLVADELGVGFDDVRVVYGDTDATPFSMLGTGGSRAATMASGAVVYGSRELKKRVLDIASHLLEANVDDLQIVDGVISVKGAPGAQVPLAQIAMGCWLAPEQMPPGTNTELEYVASYDGEGGGFSQASHACWVEIDQETGDVEVKRFLVVEDCGKMINPAIVDGQVIGGVAMGIGGMLLEHSAYSEDGQYLSATFMDYLMPTAPEIPDIEIEHLEYESDKVIGSRGVGEGGTVLAPAALLNAIDDALAQAGGGRVTTTPVTPTRVLELLGVIEPD